MFDVIVRYLGMLQNKAGLFYLLNFPPPFSLPSPAEKQGPYLKPFISQRQFEARARDAECWPLLLLARMKPPRVRCDLQN